MCWSFVVTRFSQHISLEDPKVALTVARIHLKNRDSTALAGVLTTFLSTLPGELSADELTALRRFLPAMFKEMVHGNLDMAATLGRLASNWPRYTSLRSPSNT